MKKMMAIALSLAMVTALSACGGSKPAATQAAAPAATTAAAEKPAETTAAPAAEKPAETEAAAVADFEPMELSLATSYATTHAFFPMLEKFADKVSQATNGDITIVIYDSNTLCAAADMHNAILNGVADMVETDIAYATSDFPMSTVTYLPTYQALSSKTFTYAFNEFYHQDLEEFKGMKILWAYGMTPFALQAKTEIKSIDDMKGLQIRATGAALDSMTALGASPVGLPISETYEAAQKGTVKAICNSFETLKGWNFAEVVDYGISVKGLPVGNHYIAINQDVWDSIPEAYQTAILKASDEMVDEAAGLFDQIDQEGVVFGEEQGVKFSQISEEEQLRFDEALAPVVDKWIEEKTAQGYDAQAMYDYTKGLVEKYAAQYEK